jgi:CysZ protein
VSIRSAVRDFFGGMSLIGRGLGVWRTAPGLMLLGMVPAFIVGAVILAALIALGLNLESIATAVTPFAATWDEPYRTGVRVVAGVTFVVAAVLVIVYTFTAATLILGDPFYERIWRHVEGRYGAVPSDGTTGFWRSLGRAISSGLRMLVPTVFLGLALFVLGFIPFVGSVAVLVLGAVLGGWYLTVELTGFAFDARGRSLRERRTALRGRRALTLGFGVATYLLFLVPLGAVVLMPAAVGGATLLTRKILNEPTALASSTKPAGDLGAVQN